MRRILWWLPALALAACQADAPTAIDEETQAEKTLPDNKVLFLGATLWQGYEWYEFVVPKETRVPFNVVAGGYGRLQGPSNGGEIAYWGTQEYWMHQTQDVTGDGVTDLRLMVVFGPDSPCTIDVTLPLTRTGLSLWVYFEDTATPDILEYFQLDCPIS